MSDVRCARSQAGRDVRKPIDAGWLRMSLLRKIKAWDVLNQEPANITL